ncbi:hypothetical protein UVI_02013320 [Ustilaginoidea virens]|uniref:Transcription factor 25 n=1 Tax=Ustilaginoidea virens TaxID=1159556 RepID=A0A1B5KRE2_USTVR|nr:hypothetical protein UVI_02013320 [Ustilaginoidea virens]
MSSRQLRRLQQQKETEKSQQEGGPDSDETGGDADEPGQTSIKSRPNLFAALGAGDDDGDDGDDGNDDDDNDDDGDDDGGDVGKDVEARLTESQSLDSPARATSSAQKSKQKKKKKKKKAKTKTKTKTNETKPPAIDQDQDQDEDEIDKAIKELRPDSTAASGNSAPDVQGCGNTLGPRKRLNQLLSINPHHLRAINEMRHLFGREIIESANAEEQQEATNRRRQRTPQHVDLETFLREPPGAKKLPEVSLRRNVFIQGREHWPRQSAGGLTLKEMGKSDHGLAIEYAYVHEKEYDIIQAFFFASVQLGDPMRMVHLLKERLSSVAKQDQNMSLAAELCERALFTFGRVTTSAFRRDIEQGRARLDFRRPENRQFWLAGHHYLRSLIRKGTYRTALEWAKLLFALDPGDPYAMRHYIHFLALRAYESKWLVDFLQQLESLGSFPDMVYLRQSLVLAKLQTGEVESARELLKHGVQTVPWLYCALFQELNLDAPPSIWGISPACDTRTFWTKLYLHQAKDLWNNAQATKLLQDVTATLDRVDVSRLAQEDGAVDLGSVRLAYLEGHTSLLAAAPRHLLDGQPNYEFDPLPPAEEDNIFTGQGTRLPWRGRGEQAQGLAIDDELMARMQNRLVRLGARAGAAAAAAPQGDAGFLGMNHLGADNDDDDDEEAVLALRAADDEELQRDIEAHLGRDAGQGIVATVLQMLGFGRQTARSGEDETLPEGEEDVPPGAWPEDGRTE